MNIPFVRPSLPPRAAPGRRARAGARSLAMRLALLLAAAPVAAQIATQTTTPPSAAAAAPAGPQVPPDVLARALALAAEAARAVAPREARVEVEPGRLDARLTLAPCARIEPYLPSGVPAWGRTRVGLRCTEGAKRWNVFLPVAVQVWAPARVTAAALPAGARLSESQLSLAVVDWAAASTPPVGPNEDLAGRTLARAVASGQPLRAADVQPRQWFALGDHVRIQASGSGFSIVAEGRALATGVEGQAVRVRVLTERSDGGPVLVAWPVGDHRVEVSL
ncbi:MAG: flagellar basal body P-ring formation chaperone FlgA [Rubrivivax sp.]|nr:flagellar basal body P-ring formation chaperone FlgA [Rubrivivax sp.]